MRTTVSTLSFSDSPRKADSRTTVLPSLKRRWQDVSVDWIIARAGEVRDIHIRQRQRQVLNERAHAFERAHLRIHERAATAPCDFIQQFLHLKRGKPPFGRLSKRVLRLPLPGHREARWLREFSSPNSRVRRVVKVRSSRTPISSNASGAASSCDR